MDTPEIILRDEAGNPTRKLNAEICLSCGCKVWPSMEEHLTKVCPDIPKNIEIRCRRCKRVVKTLPGTREEMAKQASNLHVYLCDLCRRYSTRRRRKNTSRFPKT